MKSILFRLRNLTLSASITVFAASVEAAPVYTITDLGTLGGTASTPSAININGQVTGQSSMAGDATYHAFLYSGGTMMDIGTMGGTFTEGYFINANGEITGSAGPGGGRAFLYNGGVMKDLGTLGGPDIVGIL